MANSERGFGRASPTVAPFADLRGWKVDKLKPYKSKYGDRWVFEYDYSTNTGIVKGPEDWEGPVVEGQALWLFLNEDQRAWVKSSWEAATRHLSNPGIYLGLDTEFMQDKRHCWLTNDYCPICLKQKMEFENHHCVAEADGGTDDYFNVLRICCTCHAIITRGSLEDRYPRGQAALNHQLMYFGAEVLGFESTSRLERDPLLKRVAAEFKSSTKAEQERANQQVKDRARLEYQYWRDVAMGKRFTNMWQRRLKRLLELKRLKEHCWG